MFLLTHNFSFFREVRYWLHKLRGQEKNQGRFYMLECTAVDGRRLSRIVPLPRLLREYQSEYHYLFASIYQAAHGSVPVAIENNYLPANMARRVLETFLAFRHPKAESLWHKLQDVNTDYSKKVRILRLVDAHSHGDIVREAEHDSFLLGEIRPALRDLLELMHNEDPGHFDGMIALVPTNG